MTHQKSASGLIVFIKMRIIYDWLLRFGWRVLLVPGFDFQRFQIGCCSVLNVTLDQERRFWVKRWTQIKAPKPSRKQPAVVGSGTTAN